MPTITAAQRTALQRRNVMRRLFVYIEATDPVDGSPSPAGFWNDFGNVIVNGRTYYGTGKLADIAPTQSSTDLTINPLVVTLSGIDPAVAALVRGETVAQKPITFSIGIFDVDTNLLIGDPIVMFVGVVDYPEIITPKMGGKSTIVLTCESIARELTVKSTDTRSHESQKLRKNTDDFFKMTEGVKEQTIYFGRAGPGGDSNKGGRR